MYTAVCRHETACTEGDNIECLLRMRETSELSVLSARKVTFLAITVVVGKSDILASFRRHIITSVFYEEAGVLVKNNVGNTQLKLEAWL